MISCIQASQPVGCFKHQSSPQSSKETNIGCWLPVSTFNLQWSLYVQLRLALLLCCCCGGQRGAFVDALLDIIEHHEHVVDPGGVARQLSDLTRHNTIWSKLVLAGDSSSCGTLQCLHSLMISNRIVEFLDVMWQCKVETNNQTEWIKMTSRGT